MTKRDAAERARSVCEDWPGIQFAVEMTPWVGRQSGRVIWRKFVRAIAEAIYESHRKGKA